MFQYFLALTHLLIQWINFLLDFFVRLCWWIGLFMCRYIDWFLFIVIFFLRNLPLFHGPMSLNIGIVIRVLIFINLFSVFGDLVLQIFFSKFYFGSFSLRTKLRARGFLGSEICRARKSWSLNKLINTYSTTILDIESFFSSRALELDFRGFL